MSASHCELEQGCLCSTKFGTALTGGREWREKARSSLAPEHNGLCLLSMTQHPQNPEQQRLQRAGRILLLWVPSLIHDQQVQDFCRTESRMHELSVKMHWKTIIALQGDKNLKAKGRRKNSNTFKMTQIS